MIAMDLGGSLPANILLKVLSDILGVVISIPLLVYQDKYDDRCWRGTYYIVHTLGPHTHVHLLITIQLVSHSSEQTGTIFPHALDVVPTTKNIGITL